MKDVTITAPPYKAQPATFFEINPFYVYRAGKHPKETWDFVTFMTGKSFRRRSFQQFAALGRHERHQVGQGLHRLGVDRRRLPAGSLGAMTRDMIGSLGGRCSRMRTRSGGEVAGELDQQGSEAVRRTQWRLGRTSPPRAEITCLRGRRWAPQRRGARRAEGRGRVKSSRAGAAPARRVLRAPAAAVFLLLIAYPLASVLRDAFQTSILINPTVSGFAGLDNFATVFADERFWPAFWRTGVWTVRLGRRRIRARPRLCDRPRPT